jgi:hypothetical protein
MQRDYSPFSAFWHSARRVVLGMIVAGAVGWCHYGHAQWLSQTNALRAGWNAVYMQVDASYATLDQLVASVPSNPIQEIWYWQPPLPTGQFVNSPLLPTGGGSQWSSWIRSQGNSNSVLQNLTGNGAFLVRLATNAAPYNWVVKGKPVSPTYKWTLTGLNFVGFPVPTTPAPTFESFFAPAPQLQQNGEVYRYQGGDLGATNPVRVFAFRTTSVVRNQAYWVRAGDAYNSYFCPIQVVQSSSSGINFGDSTGQAKLRLRNLANVPITITLRQLASEAPPAGQTNIAGAPPLLLRGPINTTNLTFTYTSLTGSTPTWNLAAAGQVGSEVEVVIGLNRSLMAGAAGALSAGVLRLTDSLGLSQIDVGVSALKQSTAGLWVGGASVSQVNHYLKPYAVATNSTQLSALLSRLGLGEGVNSYHYQLDPQSGHVLVFGGPQTNRGSYLLDGPIKVDAGTVASPFPLRLILHNAGSANSAKLLQKVFVGTGLTSNTVVATREALLLPSNLSSARRISSVHLPASAGNVPWNSTGAMQPGSSLAVSVPLDYRNQSSNPFLHTYHPDHDNLDPLFNTTLDQGIESYGVLRQITLSFTPPTDDFNSLTQSSDDLSGNYLEAITLQGINSQTRQYNVLGSFSLKRISDIATLTSN